MFGFMCNQAITSTTSTGLLKSGVKASYPQLLLHTMQLVGLDDLYNLLYSKGVKIIPTDIADWFDVVALSYFVMAAASPHVSGLVLNMGKFTFTERNLFRLMLFNNFGLITTIQSRGRVYIKAKDKVILRALVLPYLHSSRLKLFDKPLTSN